MIESPPEHTHTLHFNEEELLRFSGKNDARIAEIEEGMKVRIVARGSMLKIIGAKEAVNQTVRLVEELIDMHRSGATLQGPQMAYALRNAQEDDVNRADLRKISGDVIEVPLRTRRIRPMTACQKRYVEVISKQDIIFGVGPAGTGKTYLAMAMALNHLMDGRVRRIVLVRPAVEAGEKLGFLPGDIEAKINPYLRPLYDALYDMMEPDKVQAYLEARTIELAPLAFMRGRTLNDSFVILDEAQNTSAEQMKMFLTRLGFGSKMVITGDMTQVDLVSGRMSGLAHAHRILHKVRGVGVIEFDKRDIVRHKLVQDIIAAYEKYDERHHERFKRAERYDGRPGDDLHDDRHDDSNADDDYDYSSDDNYADENA